MLIRSKLQAVILSSILFYGVVAPDTSAAQLEDPLVRALAGYHETASAAELEAMAGGADALVERLLVLSNLETPPFVGIRAGKVLMQYADRPNVQEALASDMENESKSGLARVMTANIDSVPQVEFRRSLASAASRRAQRDAKFAPYARALAQSSDAEIRKLASQ